MNNLVIIENGFDLHHKLPTSFNDFRNFLNQELEDSLRLKYEEEVFEVEE